MSLHDDAECYWNRPSRRGRKLPPMPGAAPAIPMPTQAQRAAAAKRRRSTPIPNCPQPE